MAAALGTSRVECPLCGIAIEVPLHADMGKRVGDHVELTVTADAAPLRSHIATHDALRLAEAAHAAGEVVHLMRDEQGLTACCVRTPFELPRTDRMTFDPALRTCGANADDAGEAGE